MVRQPQIYPKWWFIRSASERMTLLFCAKWCSRIIQTFKVRQYVENVFQMLLKNGVEKLLAMSIEESRISIRKPRISKARDGILIRTVERQISDFALNYYYSYDWNDSLQIQPITEFLAFQAGFSSWEISIGRGSRPIEIFTKNSTCRMWLKSCRILIRHFKYFKIFLSANMPFNKNWLYKMRINFVWIQDWKQKNGKQSNKNML